jgi:hypothetical protein
LTGAEWTVIGGLSAVADPDLPGTWTLQPKRCESRQTLATDPAPYTLELLGFCLQCMLTKGRDMRIAAYPSKAEPRLAWATPPSTVMVSPTT